jgi:hypothetical protein
MSASSTLVATSKRLPPGTTSLTSEGAGRSRLEAMVGEGEGDGTLDTVSLNGNPETGALNDMITRAKDGSGAPDTGVLNVSSKGATDDITSRKSREVAWKPSELPLPRDLELVEPRYAPPSIWPSEMRIEELLPHVSQVVGLLLPKVFQVVVLRIAPPSVSPSELLPGVLQMVGPPDGTL